MSGLLGVVLSASVLAADQRVTAVTVRGVTGAQSDEVHRRVRVRAGDVYSQRAVQEDYLAILRLPFVLKASLKQAESPEGIEIIYEIDAREALETIRFEGNKKLKRKKLLVIGDLKNFTYYDPARLNDAAGLIAREYHKKGYIFAKVSFARKPDSTVVFTIEENKRTKVKTVTIIGNTHFDEAVLKKEVKTRTRKYLLFSYRLDRGVVEDDVMRLRDFYREHGYLDARVTVRINVDEKKRRHITVEYLITEGQLYTVSNVEMFGNEIIATDALKGRLKMLEGKPFSPSGLAADAAALKGAYGLIGYIDAKVRPVTTIEQAQPRVHVSYRIAEGAEIYINEVNIFGNDRTRDNVIRRELEFAPTEKFDTQAIEQSKFNMKRQGFFTKVDIEAKETEDPVKRDVVVNVEETETGQLQLGIQASSDSGISGLIVFNQRNFDYRRPPRSWRDFTEGRAWTGGGQSLSLNAEPGTEVTRFRISYKDSRLNDSIYRLGLEAQRWERDRETYTEKRTSGAVSMGRSFGKNSFWDISATVGEVEISDPEPGVPSVVTKVMGSNQVNILGLTVGKDTRNSFVSPTKGYLVKGTAEVSSEVLGSDFDFLRLIFSGRWYRELSRDELDRPYVLAARSRLGVMIPEDGSADSPIFERFFAGGSADVRGFEFRGLGPHAGDEPLGGEFVFTGGLQYEYPLTGEKFRGQVFWDFGNLVDDPGDFKFDDVRHTLGAGFRFAIPPPLNMSIGLDFGLALNDDDEDRTKTVSIVFGGAF